MGRFLSYKNDADMEKALMAMAGAQSAKEAVLFLKEEFNHTVTEKGLESFVRAFPERYQELREKIAPLRERTLTANLRDNALYASEVTRMGMEQLQDLLEKGKIEPQYVSRVARDIADVQAKSIDKMLALEGRPTAIIEQRTPDQIIARLERMRVLKPVHVTQGSVEVLEESCG